MSYNTIVGKVKRFDCAIILEHDQNSKPIARKSKRKSPPKNKIRKLIRFLEPLLKEKMRTLFLLFVIASVLIGGCSSKPYQPKKKAESIIGTVTFNDKAIANAEIRFSDSARGINFTVKTGADGKFTIAPKDLPIGRYSAFITPSNPKDIPQQYQSPMESPLYLEIKEGSNDLNVAMEK
jgi:hypothetical protein